MAHGRKISPVGVLDLIRRVKVGDSLSHKEIEMSENRSEDLKEFREFLDAVDPAVVDLQDYYGGSRIEAFQTYLLLGIISELKTLTGIVSEGNTFPAGALKPEDVDLFMRTMGLKPN